MRGEGLVKLFTPIALVGCSHPSIELRGNTWYCTSCHNPVGQAALSAIPYGQCDHPAIYFKDGRPYCTECHQLRS